MVALSIKESRFCFDLLLIFSQTASFTIASLSDQLRTLPSVNTAEIEFRQGPPGWLLDSAKCSPIEDLGDWMFQ
jgi:hypothetical protein